MKYIIIAIILISLIWLIRSQQPRLNKYNRHICQDIYGLNERCQ